MSHHYILQGTVAVPVDDGVAWARYFESADRIVAQTTVTEDVIVSTVFLGLNHQFGDGPPLLFETMVFGGPLDQAQARYPTWHEAEQGHEAMCARVREVLSAPEAPAEEGP